MVINQEETVSYFKGITPDLIVQEDTKSLRSCDTPNTNLDKIQTRLSLTNKKLQERLSMALDSA
jgi:hypothetical protein